MNITNNGESTAYMAAPQQMNPTQFATLGCSQFPQCTQFSMVQNQNNIINNMSIFNNSIDMRNQQPLIQNSIYLPENTCNQVPFYTNQNIINSNLIRPINQSKNKPTKPHPKTKFTNQEDLQLLELVKKYGTNNWYQISKEMNGRNIRQCRERYKNYLTPDVTNGPWTQEEDDLLFEAFSKYGARWKLIASFFPSRTDINIKSRWQVHFRRYIRQTKNIVKKRFNNQQNPKLNYNLADSNNILNSSQRECMDGNSNAASLYNQTLMNHATLPIPSISNENRNSNKPRNGNNTNDGQNKNAQHESSLNLLPKQNSQAESNISDENKDIIGQNDFDDIFDDFVDTSFFDPSMSLYDEYRMMDNGMGF